MKHYSTYKLFSSILFSFVAFVQLNAQVAKIGSTSYNTLEDALNAAVSGNTVVLTKDYTLNKAVTVKSGVTLLIPYDDGNTVSTLTPKTLTSWSGLGDKPYKKLSLVDGGEITVEGAISVGGQQFSTSNAYNGSNGGPGSPCGAYGCIDMSQGGKIVLESGSNLYAWGFITGQNKDEGNNTSGVGEIEAKSGSTVYESFVIADYHGGGATAAMTNDSKRTKFKVFPFNQYIIPNIEVPLTLESGATENAVTSINSTVGFSGQVAIPFIGSSEELFKIGYGGKLKKWYDATTDRQCFESWGDITINSIKVSQSGQSFTSSEYVLPLTNNISFTVHNGELKVPYDVALFAGASITIDEDATATASKDVYVYDADQWDQFGYNYARTSYAFRPTKHSNQEYKEKNLKDDAH